MSVASVKLREQVFPERKKNELRTYWGRLAYFQASKAKDRARQVLGKNDCYDAAILGEPLSEVAYMGVKMLDTTMELQETNKELEIAREQFLNLKNEITQVHDLVEPELLGMIKRIRETRNTVVRELTQELNLLRDVRTPTIDFGFGELEHLAHKIETELYPVTINQCWNRGAAFTLMLEKAIKILEGNA